MLNVEITRTGTDNTMNVIRKFSRRVQSSGLIPHVRKSRSKERPLSDAKKKQGALHRITKAAERIQLIKDGKISDAPERRGRRAPRRSAIPSKPSAAALALRAPEVATPTEPTTDKKTTPSESK